MHRLSDHYKANVALLDRTLRVQESFDLTKRTLPVGNGGDELTLYAVNGFTDAESMQRLLLKLLTLPSLSFDEGEGRGRAERGRTEAEHFLAAAVPSMDSEITDDPSVMLRAVLSGSALILGTTFHTYAVVVDTRTYPSRPPQEPQDDRVMKGARDGFVEALVQNTALIRRRIRDPRLTMERHTVGSLSQSDVILCYLDGKADPDYVRALGERLDHIRTDTLVMGHQSLIECLIRRKWYNPFPKVRTTGRPDTAAAQVAEGSVLLLVDNSPEVLILPTTIFDFLQETNDFYFPPLTGGYLRLVRHIVFFLTLFLTPAWYLATLYPSSVPEWLSFVLPDEAGKLPIIAQLLLVEFLIDGLRLASMNTPDMLSNSLSVVGGLILGDFAVEIGWLIPEVILYMAFVAIANFTQRSYQLGYAFKFLRLILLVLTAFFRIYGFFIGIFVIFLLLVTNKTVNGRRNYLYPLFPLRLSALRTILLRTLKPTGEEKR